MDINVCLFTSVIPMRLPFQQQDVPAVHVDRVPSLPPIQDAYFAPGECYNPDNSRGHWGICYTARVRPGTCSYQPFTDYATRRRIRRYNPCPWSSQ